MSDWKSEEVEDVENTSPMAIFRYCSTSNNFGRLLRMASFVQNVYRFPGGRDR